MKKLTLIELQEYLLSSLVAFDSFCKKHAIHYSLCGGTLIGAIRHQGFIPWDDDIDVMMTRQEYDKLTKIWLQYPKEGYTLITNRTTSNAFAGESGKWYANNTAPTYPRNDFDIGLFMDIFVIDTLPEDEQKAKKYFAKVHRLGRQFHIIRKRMHKPLWKLFATLFPMFHPDKVFSQLEKEIARHRDKENTYGAIMLGSSNDMLRERLPTNYLKHFVAVPFNGHLFPAIAQYDAYLRHYYGDYMQLPPEKERLSYHTKNHILKE